MKYTLLHCYSDDNRGDAGIIAATVDLLKKHDLQSEIKAVSVFHSKDYRYENSHSFTEKEVDGILPSLFPSVDLNFSKDKSANSLLKSFFFVYFLIRYLIICIIPNNTVAFLVGYNRNEREALREFKSSDKFISKGGSFLYSFKGVKGTLFSIRMLLQFLLPLRLEKEVYIFAQSIGPFENKLPKNIFLFLSKKLNHIYLREEKCLKYLDGNIQNYTVIPDAAFGLGKVNGPNLVNSFTEGQSENNLKIGITARPHFSNNAKGLRLYRNYIKQLQICIKSIIREHNAQIILIPQVIGPSIREDDRESLKLILEDLSIDERDKHFIVLDDSFSPRELKHVYSQLDILIGTRLHSCIFALSENVPCINISYHGTKSIGIMGDMGLSDYVFDIGRVTGSDLCRAVNSIINNQNVVKETISSKMITYSEKLDRAGIDITQAAI